MSKYSASLANDESNEGTNRKETASRKRRFRFGLGTLLLFLTALPITVEKPLRKFLGVQTIEAFGEGTEAPELRMAYLQQARALKFSNEPLTSWGKFWHWLQPVSRQDIVHVAIESEVSDEGDAFRQTVLANPTATENLHSLVVTGPLSPELEKFILSRKHLRKLTVEATITSSMLQDLQELKQLEELTISVFNSDEDILKHIPKLKWARWIRINGPLAEDSLTELREALPNTYVQDFF